MILDQLKKLDGDFDSLSTAVSDLRVTMENRMTTLEERGRRNAALLGMAGASAIELFLWLLRTTGGSG